MDNSKPLSLMAACRDYFGTKDGQTAIQFGMEYKALTDDDKKEIADGLRANGYSIINA